MSEAMIKADAWKSTGMADQPCMLGPVALLEDAI